jgi:hypothetical protein
VEKGHVQMKRPYISCLGWVGFEVGMKGYIGPSGLTLTQIIPKIRILSRTFFISPLREKVLRFRQVAKAGLSELLHVKTITNHSIS